MPPVRLVIELDSENEVYYGKEQESSIKGKEETEAAEEIKEAVRQYASRSA